MKSPSRPKRRSVTRALRRVKALVARHARKRTIERARFVLANQYLAAKYNPR